ncbi:MAG: hypothetical protein WD071_08105 [Pseudohongiella sp.]|uniref:hypothetical protein n=1 Tax=Pseudohongiella sp. TaxID=1979412 RepID=UPI0034A07CA0
MKAQIAGVGLTGLMTLSALAYAGAPDNYVEQSVTLAEEYGITHFYELEFDDGNRADIEGWVDDEWFVEIGLRGDQIAQEERERRIDGPWGMTAGELRGYVQAAITEGMVSIEEIAINNQGIVEVEGEDANGRDIDVYFRTGDTEPESVQRD